MLRNCVRSTHAGLIHLSVIPRLDRRVLKMKGIIMKNITICLTLILLSGCSVFMAAKQPDAKNLDLLAVGTPRNLLLAEFGLPVVSEEKEGKKYDVFKFIQGYSAGAKAGRAVFHGAADIATLGLWEVIGTPTEGVFDGNEMVFQVRYDDNDRADEVIPLKK